MTLTTERQQFEQWWETTMHNGYPPRFGWEHWRDGDGYRDDDGEFQGLWQAWQASRGFLANREAQPVAATPIYQIWDDDGWCDTSEQIWRETYDDFRKEQYRIVYTAQPAPAVPSFDEWLERTGTHPVGWVRGVMEESYNACRAAMLESVAATSSIPIISGSYKLPEGWVACSERMPDNDETKPIAIYTGKCLGQGMFVATYDEDGFFDYWEGGEIIGVTHWMPLPAAPEGGNG